MNNLTQNVQRVVIAGMVATALGYRSYEHFVGDLGVTAKDRLFDIIRALPANLSKQEAAQAALAEWKKRRKGGQLGNHNAWKPKRPKLPVHQVSSDAEVIDATRDLLWCSGQWMTAHEIVKQLEIYLPLREANVYRVINDFAKRSLDREWKWIKGQRIERFKAREKRSGYYYRGKLRSLREVARITGFTYSVLQKRLKSNSLTDALVRPIDANKVTKLKAAA